EEVASKHLGNQLAYFSYIHATTLLFKDSRTGILPSLRTVIGQEGDDHTEAWNETIDNAFSQLQDMKEHWDKLFEWLYTIVTANVDMPDTSNDQNNGMVLRLSAADLPKDWSEALEVENNFHVNIARFLKSIEKMSSDIKDRLDEELSLQG